MVRRTGSWVEQIGHMIGQSGQFRVISTGMVGIFRTSQWTGIETPLNCTAPNFGQYQMVSDVPGNFQCSSRKKKTGR